MAEDSLPTVPLSGKSADFATIAHSLARIELEAMQAYFESMAASVITILAMEDLRSGIPILDFLAENENARLRLNTIQEMLGVEVDA